jgi:hypothetical protein
VEVPCIFIFLNLISVLMGFVSRRFFRFKLAMGLYVMAPFWFDKVSRLTRTSVYLNLPVCCAGALVLALSLNGIELATSKGSTWKDFLRRFDFIGL